MNLHSYIEEFKAHNYDNFPSFYMKTFKQIYFTAYSILTDSAEIDGIIKETYISFLNNLASYRGRKASMSLIAIARNKSLSLAKANKPISSGSILNSNIANSNYPSLEGILGLLKAQEEREAIIYHKLLGYSLIEISKIMGISLYNTAIIYNRAIRNLLNKG